MSVIDQLVALVKELYVESENYAENPSDVQLWYNRGYANGIVRFLNARGYTDETNHLKLDAEDLYHGQQVMEWHKAYHHGFEMGLRESGEVLR
jgi:hypothetical protein